MASFLDKVEEAGDKFSGHELVFFEYRPLLCYWLASIDDDARRKFQMVGALRLVFRDRGHPLQ
eukprot:3688779-Rhodomonas_salina.1